MTPDYPQDGPTVAGWLERDLGLALRAYSGIRAVHDHLPAPIAEAAPYDDLLAAERYWGRLEPYRSLARYIHILGQKPVGSSGAATCGALGL